MAEFEGWKGDAVLPCDGWRASNRFAHPLAAPALRVWTGKVTIDEITPISYQSGAVEGEHGVEGCYAALGCGDRLIGSPDRATSYPANAWEYPACQQKTGHTCSIPLDVSLVGEEVAVVLPGMNYGGAKLNLVVWLTAREHPFTAERVR